METYLDLTKGLHTDFEPINQPQGSYRNMLNAIRQVSGAILNEKGTTLIQQFTTGGRRILGSYSLDTDTIICSSDGVSSEIGILDKNSKYTTIPILANLNFKLGSVIKMEGKKNFKGERIIYLVEKNGVNPMRAINIDDKSLLASPTFLDDIKLQVNPSSPSINVTGVVDGGNLPTGVYQAVARLLTRSTNAAPFGLVSPIVPIIDDSSSVNIDQQDGANPQSLSPKAINFEITGIDTSYAYIEIAIITYTGTANISSAVSVAKLPIDGRSTINFTYSSTSQNKEAIDLEAVAIKPVIYTSASSIAQKDGILTIGNLQTTIDTYNYQLAANKVTLRYTIEEVPIIPGYKDPLLVANKKGYQRDEIYSFAMVPDIDGEYNTTAYHIPSISIRDIANVDTKEMGMYLSSEQYPQGKGYPTDFSGYVRHHRMPNMQQEPILVTRDGQTYIRILAVEADFTECLATIPSATAKKIKGFSLVRQVRTEENKSIVAQGIANSHFKMDNTSFQFLSALPKDIYDFSHFIRDSKPRDNLVGFFSPETVIYQSPIVGNTVLKTVAQLEGTQQLVHDLRTHDNENGVPANFQVFLDYTNLKPAYEVDVAIVSNSAQYIREDSASTQGPNLANVLINGTSDTVNNYKNNSYLFLKLGFRLPVRQQRFNSSDGEINSIPEFFYNYKGSSATDKIYLNGKEQGINGATGKESSDRYLYNITRQLSSQYGAIFDAQYIYCGYTTIANTIVKVFGGDIFIGKFGVVTTGAIAGGEDEINYSVLSYYYCESTINVGYRHYSTPVGTENTSSYIPGTTPYYPKLSILYNDPKDSALTPGILNLSWTLGHGRGYNKQYSFENSITKYYPKQLAEENVSSYANRVIYSEQSVEGEQVDSYRIFLPNNYHDVPKDKGEITELFIHNHRYYIHTSGALYISAFNERVSQISSIGEVYLGNGGVFSRPSEPVLTLNGGYAGTTSSASINTPFGRLFIDNINSKIYLLTESLKEISAQGMTTYFNSRIEDTVDSPSLGLGYAVTYDAINFRILLTRVGEWTLSYSPQLDSWSSFHSYTPYTYITRNQQFYSAIDNQLHQHNVGDYGVYYGNIPSPLQLDIVLNDAPNVTKTFDNLKFYTTSQNQSNIEQHYDTFSTLQCYTNRQNTGKCRLIVPRSFAEDFQPLGVYECFAKPKSNEFRVSIPNDLVLDVNQSIFVASNLDISRAYRPSINGKWAIVSLSYTNLRNNRFVIHNIGRIFRQRIR